MRQRLYVDATGWHGTNEDMSLLPIVQNAVSSDRKLKIRYRKVAKDDESSRSERTVDPLGLVAKGNVWYLVAQAPTGLRTFRVSRIEEATLLDKPCERPKDFDLRTYWKSSTKQFKENRPRYYATLCLEPSAAKQINMWRITLPPDSREGPDPQGWVTLRVQFDDVEEACFVVLGFGPRVDVVEPESLRERISRDVKAMLERYGKTSSQGE